MKIRIFKHSPHPPTVHLTIGLLISVNIFDTVYLITQELIWLEISHKVLLIGLLTSLLPISTGLIELLSIDSKKDREIKTAFVHMSIMFLSVLIYFISYIFRKPPGEITASNFIIFYLIEFTGLLFLLIGGWFGGELVYKYKIGIDE